MNLRESKKAETRDRIAIAAVTKYMELGAEGATIAVISEEANISPRTFHNYFTHREDAFLHFCTQHVSHSAEFIRELPESVGAIEALEQLILDTYRRPANDIYSWATLARIAEAVKIYFNALRDADPESACVSNEDGLEILDPVSQELIRRSKGKLDPFNAFLMLGFSFTLAEGVNKAKDMVSVTNGANVEDLLRTGFRTMRTGFGDI